MASTFADKAFDFYGSYVKIAEPQKYKYQEQRLVAFYKDLCIEALEKNLTIQNEIDSVRELN